MYIAKIMELISCAFNNHMQKADFLIMQLIAVYLLNLIRPKKKIVVFQVPCQKKTGSVGRLYFFSFFF